MTRTLLALLLLCAPAWGQVYNVADYGATVDSGERGDDDEAWQAAVDAAVASGKRYSRIEATPGSYSFNKAVDLTQLNNGIRDFDGRGVEIFADGCSVFVKEPPWTNASGPLTIGGQTVRMQVETPLVTRLTTGGRNYMQGYHAHSWKSLRLVFGAPAPTAEYDYQGRRDELVVSVTQTEGEATLRDVLRAIEASGMASFDMQAADGDAVVTQADADAFSHELAGGSRQHIYDPPNSGAPKVEFYGFSLRGDRTPGESGFRINRTWFLRLDRCNVRGFDSGVTLSWCTGGMISQCEVSECTYGGIDLRSSWYPGGGSTESENGFVVLGNRVRCHKGAEFGYRVWNAAATTFISNICEGGAPGHDFVYHCQSTTMGSATNIEPYTEHGGESLAAFKVMDGAGFLLNVMGGMCIGNGMFADLSEGYSSTALNMLGVGKFAGYARGTLFKTIDSKNGPRWVMLGHSRADLLHPDRWTPRVGNAIATNQQDGGQIDGVGRIQSERFDLDTETFYLSGSDVVRDRSIRKLVYDRGPLRISPNWGRAIEYTLTASSDMVQFGDHSRDASLEHMEVLLIQDEKGGHTVDLEGSADVRLGAGLSSELINTKPGGETLLKITARNKTLIVTEIVAL